MKRIRLVFFLAGLLHFSVSAQEEALQPTEHKVLVKLIVTDYDSVPEESAGILLESTDGKVRKHGDTDINGVYKTLLPKGKTYNLSVRKFDTVFKFSPIKLPDRAGRMRFVNHMQIRYVTDYVRSYVLENVYFETNKHKIKEESEPALKELLQAMKSNKDMKIEVAGHTDNVGSMKANHRLSQRRANAVRDYLVKRGISKDRIVPKGYGETKPVASNDTPEGRQRNRRTEIKIIQE